MYRLLILIIAACCLSLGASSKQDITYMSSNVARIAAVLAPIDLDSLHQGWNYAEHNGLPLSIRVNEYGQLEHIGIPLFTHKVRQAYPLPVYDFIEQAYLKYKFKNRLAPGLSDTYSDDVTFSVGSWRSLDNVNDSTDITVNYIENVRYTVTWSNGGTTIASMAVPMEYDIFMSVSRKELEQIYMRNLAEHRTMSAPGTLDIDTANLIPLTEAPGNVYVHKGRTHMQPAINKDIYLVKAVDGTYDILYDGNYPTESLINIINAYGCIDRYKPITLKFNLYGNRKETVTVPLRQLLAYSASQHETPYVGIERVTDEAIEMSLFLDNPASGYEHVIFIRCDTSAITDPDVPLYGEAYLYSPTKKQEI